MGIFAAVVSFIGFFLENVWLAITKGYIDNRNMSLPFLLGYGILLICFGCCFGTPNNISIFGIKTDITGKASWIFYFVVAFIIICVGEHILGTIVEKICGIEYWNYEWIPFKISKYTTVPTSIGFALLLTLFMGYAVNPLSNFLTSIDRTVALQISIIITLLLVIDFAASFTYMYQNKSYNEKWRINLKK